jgi:drug/metabolite transporter (DMT)-like permease
MAEPSTDVRTPTAAPGEIHFGPSEWSLSVVVAVVWGSSFLWIAIAIDDLAAPVVPMGRLAFGALALAALPSARRTIRRADVGLFAVLGLVWMAVPFLLYPIAERTVSSSVTGMINGGLPVVTTVVTAFWTRTRPSALRVVAVAVGFIGIAMVALSSASGAAADLPGIALLLAALVCYAVAANLAVPVQRRYGALVSMLWIVLFGLVWSLPLGIPAMWRSNHTWSAWLSLLVLGAVGTGIAFAVYGTLLLRAGPVRGMIGIFFTPIVGTLLGVAVRSEPLAPLAVVGMFVVIVGAVLTSRPEPRARSAAHDR